MSKEFVQSFALCDAIESIESLIECNLNTDPKLRTEQEIALGRIWNHRLEHYRSLQRSVSKHVRGRVRRVLRIEHRLIQDLIDVEALPVTKAGAR
ncbi:MAG TPA: hypothetical protein VN622_11115 [Clostridia bacterium]|nr:hypothetical protein [Clostridia bacterium]